MKFYHYFNNKNQWMLKDFYNFTVCCVFKRTIAFIYFAGLTV